MTKRENLGGSYDDGKTFILANDPRHNDKTIKDDFIPRDGVSKPREPISWKWFFKGIAKIIYVLLTEPKVHRPPVNLNVKTVEEQQKVDDEEEDMDDFDTEMLDFIGD